jgi:hypothetical protein
VKAFEDYSRWISPELEQAETRNKSRECVNRVKKKL